MNAALWKPDQARIDQANITQFMRRMEQEHGLSFTDYNDLYQWSVAQPEAFWQGVWDFCGIIGERGEGPVIRDADKMPGAQFFPEARINFAENLLRYRDDRPAILGRCEQNLLIQYSHAELYEEVKSLAAALKAMGVEPGDRVAGYLPNIPGTIIAMLAATSLGAIWSSCSPDFGIESMFDRFGQIEPKVLFVTTAYSYNGKVFRYLDKTRAVAERIASIEKIVVIPSPVTRAAGHDPAIDEEEIAKTDKAVKYEDFVVTDAPDIEFARMPFNHPLYILFSSGTTGKPKCITHGAGGTLIQHLKELVFHTDMKREDTMFYYTTCGWMMWNWMVSTLATGASLVCYDGSPFYRGAMRMFNIVRDNQVTVFGTSAKAIASWQNVGLSLAGKDHADTLRTMLSTGSPLLPEQFDYVYQNLKSDICLSSISGGTDIVSCFALGNPVLPVNQGELQCAGLGMQVEIRDDNGQVVHNQTGELTCSAPFPCMPVGFWNDADGSRYRKAYFERFDNIWAHGDFAKQTENDGFIIYGRSDATLNPGGVRIGTAEIYRQVEQLDAVHESLCVGQEWDGDQRVVLFVVLAPDVELDKALMDEIRNSIRANTTPRHVPAKIIQVPEIPRTISGKIVELAVRDVIHGREVQNKGALANPDALNHFRDRPELQS